MTGKSVLKKEIHAALKKTLNVFVDQVSHTGILADVYVMVSRLSNGFVHEIFRALCIKFSGFVYKILCPKRSTYSYTIQAPKIL